MTEAMYYQKNEDGTVTCLLCPHRCTIKNQKTGICRVRKNCEGILIALNYGIISSLCIDPIEKKPLHQFYPGTQIVSVGSFGCNMHCSFCQNYEISLEFDISRRGKEITHEEVLEYTLSNKISSIALTYNEPTVFYEWVIGMCKTAKKNDIKTVLVTNGYIEEEPFYELAPFVDAMNIDIKATNEADYRRLGGQLQSVINTVVRAKKLGIHVEITCLLVPDLFYDLEDCTDFFERLYENIGDTYIHLSRYFPRYMYDLEATSIQRMIEIKECAMHFFSNISLGNV